MSDLSPDINRPSWLKRLASASAPFYLLPWLMVLLVAGTVAQKDLGLYEAHRIFFGSWFIWLGPIPLPGTYLTLGALTAALAAKFLFYSPWRWERAGTILTHLGILILLLGGIITAFSQKEFFLVLKEGEQSNLMRDYHARVLTIAKNSEVIALLPYDMLEKGKALDIAGVPFKLEVLSACRNCRPAPPPANNPVPRHGLAAEIALVNAPPEKENETNLSGVTFALTGLPDAQDGIYASMEDIPHIPAIEMDGATYHLKMERAPSALPFGIELVKFTRDLYPGTQTARGFSSNIIVHDNGVAWPYTIQMNEPMRYKGYTFYQASFTQRPDGIASVLSVVQNKGRAFPYLASAVIFAGLLLHLLLRLKPRRKESA